MAETPSQSPPPSRSVSETETVTEEAPQEYWCYHCDKRVSVETVANLPDIVCHDCKNGFVESIPRSDPPSQPSDQASDPYGSPFLQVLRLFAQAARDEDAPPPLPQNRTSEEDFLRIELDGWDNDEDEDDDAHSVEFHNEGGVENEEAEVVEEDEEDENQERDEEDLRRRRRDVLRLRIRDFATRAQSGRNQILDWAQILMGLEDNSIELRFEMPESDRYVGNPEDYVDAAGYEALLQTLAESDGSGRRGAPPASKAAVSELPAVDEAVVCAICKDMVNVDELSKKLPCGHGYHGDCIVPSEEETEEDAEKNEDEDAEKKPKTKTVKETSQEWELLNDVKAIWLRNPKEVTEEEYAKFYQTLAKDFSEEKPLSWSHFTAEGDVEFKAVLFVPPKAPHDLYESYYNANKSNLKLYVRRVFISDEFDELLPKYLSFLKGLIDSDTLPLNVSREMLQAHSSLKTIKKKLIRKALDMIRKLAEEDPDESNDKAKKDVEKSDDDDEKRGQYTRFWNEFGKSIKLGIIEDAANRNRLAKLLRFESTKSDGKLTSLDQYISRMKSGQKDIFYLTGTSKEQLDNSPFLERLKKKGYEVIFFTDPVDEYLMQYLMDYEDKKFQNVSKEGLKLGKDSKDKELKESYKELTKWWKGALASDNVDDVKISNRLADTPCVVVTSKFGWSANMEKIMQSQTLSDSAKQAYMRGKRVLEINPRHPIIKELRERVVKNPEDESVKHTAQLIYQTALMESGFVLSDPKDFASRIYSSVKSSLNINPDATVEEEDDTEDPAEAETPANEGTPEAEAANADSLKDEL